MRIHRSESSAVAAGRYDAAAVLCTAAYVDQRDFLFARSAPVHVWPISHRPRRQQFTTYIQVNKAHYGLEIVRPRSQLYMLVSSARSS